MRRPLCVELDWIFEKLGDQGCDLRALRPSQGDVGKERVALKGFNNCHNSVMATNAEVVSLCDVMGQNNARTLADSREHC